VLDRTALFMENNINLGTYDDAEGLVWKMLEIYSG
jgi:hypothetical protein